VCIPIPIYLSAFAYIYIDLPLSILTADKQLKMTLSSSWFERQYKNFFDYSTAVENIHFTYVHLTMIMVAINIAVFLLTGYRIQWLLFLIAFSTQCEYSFMNLVHAALVLMHDQIHIYLSYHTIVETHTVTLDEYWHLFYILFIASRLYRAFPIYKRVVTVYLCVTVCSLLYHLDLLFWLLYFNGFAIAYQLIWLESGTLANKWYWLYCVVHAFFSLIITFDNPIGRWILIGIPAGAAFFSECLVYSMLSDHYARKSPHSHSD
jgi:hypothetical protein